MKQNILGKTGLSVSQITYGGIISMDDGQLNSDKYVQYAIDKGVNYFDIAPTYGDAEEKVGKSLQPFRKDVYLACKTVERDGKLARDFLENSLKQLKTDYFDVYQMHSLMNVADAEKAFEVGGAMEIIADAKKSGLVRFVGITCHSEDAAMYALSMYDFDTVLFPTNYGLHMGKGFGSEISRVAKEKNLGFLGMKSLIHRPWKDEEEQKAYPKSWCKPFYGDNELAIAAMKYATNVLGAQTLIPPGNFEHFKFSVEHADEAFKPLTSSEKELLEKELEAIDGKYFM